MSATLDGAAAAALLGDAPLLTSEGRSHPVAVRYAAGEPRDPEERLPQTVQQAVLHALERDPGDLLVFLPGGREIRRTEAILAQPLGRRAIGLYPLCGALQWE